MLDEYGGLQAALKRSDELKNLDPQRRGRTIIDGYATYAVRGRSGHFQQEAMNRTPPGDRRRSDAVMNAS